MPPKRPWLPHMVVPWQHQWRHIKRDTDRQGGEFAHKPANAEEYIKRTQEWLLKVKRRGPGNMESDDWEGDSIGKLADKLRADREELRLAQERAEKQAGKVAQTVQRRAEKIRDVVGKHDVFKTRMYNDIAAKSTAVESGGRPRRAVSEGEAEILDTVARKLVAKEKQLMSKPKKRVNPEAERDLTHLGKADLAELEDLTLEKYHNMSAEEADALSNRLTKAKRDRFEAIIKAHEKKARKDNEERPNISNEDFEKLSKKVAERSEKIKRKREIKKVKNIIAEFDAGVLTGKKRRKKFIAPPKVMVAPVKPATPAKKPVRRIALQPV